MNSINRYFRVFLCRGLGLLLVLCCAEGAEAESITAYLTADTYIDCKFSSANYGKNSIMRLCLNYNSNPSRGIMQMPDINVPDGSSITSAKLYLYCSTLSSDLTQLAAYALTTDCDVSKVTWNTYDGTNSWTTAGGDYDSSVYAVSSTISEGSWFSIDLTSIWSDDDVQDNGLLLTYYPESHTPATGFYSMTIGTYESNIYAPYVVIAYETVPEPAVVVMLISGLVGCGASIVRKRTSQK